MESFMQHTLGRIEKEFVFQALKESTFPLSVQIGQNLVVCPQNSYFLNHNNLTLYTDLNTDAVKDNPQVKSFFVYKGCTFFFEAQLVSINDFVQKHSASKSLELVYTIGSSVFKLNPKDHQKKSLLEIKAQKDFIFYENPQFSLFSINIDPLQIENFYQNIIRVSQHFKVSTQGVSLVSIRLFDYISRLKKEALHTEESSFIVFIDHESFFLTTQQESFFETAKPYTVSFTAQTNTQRRFIECSVFLKNKVSVNKRVSILSFEYLDLKLEDKRFLFENVYKLPFND